MDCFASLAMTVKCYLETNRNAAPDKPIATQPSH